MDISLMTIRIVLLLVPGIIGTAINDALVDVEKKDTREFLVSTIIFSASSYIVLYLFGYNISLFKILNEENYIVNIREVIWASGISVTFAIIVSLLSNKKWLFILMQKLKITNKLSEANVFKSIVNDKNVLNSYITVRDFNNGIMYEGVLLKFSEIKGVYELFLGEVTVYNSETAEEYYSIDRIYINSDLKGVTIEIRELEGETENGESV